MTFSLLSSVVSLIGNFVTAATLNSEETGTTFLTLSTITLAHWLHFVVHYFGSAPIMLNDIPFPQTILLGNPERHLPIRSQIYAVYLYILRPGRFSKALAGVDFPVVDPCRRLSHAVRSKALSPTKKDTKVVPQPFRVSCFQNTKWCWILTNWSVALSVWNTKFCWHCVSLEI